MSQGGAPVTRTAPACMAPRRTQPLRALCAAPLTNPVIGTAPTRWTPALTPTTWTSRHPTPEGYTDPCQAEAHASRALHTPPPGQRREAASERHGSREHITRTQNRHTRPYRPCRPHSTRRPPSPTGHDPESSRKVRDSRETTTHTQPPHVDPDRTFVRAGSSNAVRPRSGLGVG